MKASLTMVCGCWSLVCFTAGFLVALTGLETSAQTLTTIKTNGPTSNRINIVVLSEGYQAGQLGTFLRDATNAVNSILASTPYREYSNYFNAFAISVASAQSGSDHHTPSTTLLDTYFNSTFDSYGTQRLITIPPNDWDSAYSHGQGKVDALLQSLMPEYDIVIMVVNDTQYGGSGGPVLMTSVNSESPEIVVHELGHSFGRLTDEYSSAFPAWNPVEYPNATAITNRDLIKWTSWILRTTPIPTPGTVSYTNLVGLFLGAEYQTAGWYRPKYDCKMNHLGIPFCEVCGEQIVKSICKTVRSFDTFAPASTNISVSTTQAISFNVALLRPTTHTLTVQWFTNGTAVNAATNFSFTLFPEFFSRGTNLVRAEIRDLTALVRNDPANVLSTSVTWSLDVVPSHLRFVSANWLAGGKFGFALTGIAPHGFVLQSSTNLSSWLPLSTNTLIGGQFNYTNSGADASPSRFYRAVITP